MVHQAAKLHMKLSESKFPFSKRMLNFFDKAGISTIGDLAAIPLSEFTCFRGFKIKCEEELTAFIEFEQIQNYFSK